MVLRDALIVGLTILGCAVLGLIGWMLIGLRDSPTDQDSKHWKAEVYILRELRKGNKADRAVLLLALATASMTLAVLILTAVLVLGD